MGPGGVRGRYCLADRAQHLRATTRSRGIFVRQHLGRLVVGVVFSLLVPVPPTGVYHSLKVIRTDRRGYLRTGVKALSGTRSYRWVFKANAATQDPVAAPDCVRAR